MKHAGEDTKTARILVIDAAPDTHQSVKFFSSTRTFFQGPFHLSIELSDGVNCAIQRWNE